VVDIEVEENEGEPPRGQGEEEGEKIPYGQGMSHDF